MNNDLSEIDCPSSTGHTIESTSLTFSILNMNFKGIPPNVSMYLANLSRLS